MNKKLVDLFLKLVSIDSPSGSEGAMGKYVMDYLGGLGIKAIADKYGNIYAERKSAKESVLISCHLDTVEPGREIKPKLEGNLIKSDGNTILGADNKASLAAVLYAISQVNKGSSFELLFTTKEETEGNIKKFDFAKLKSKRAYIADSVSPMGSVILSSPTIETFKLIIMGKAAHASMPEKGINALKAASEIVYSLDLGKIYPKTVINIGLIKGGSATNTIPDEVELDGEIRSFSEEERIKTIKVLNKIINGVVKKYKVKKVLEFERYCKGYRLKKEDEIVKNVVSFYKKLGITPIYKDFFGASDGNYLFEKGIEVVNLGDGVKNAHTKNECISVGDLERLNIIFKNILE